MKKSEGGAQGKRDAPHSLRACLRSPTKREKRTPVMQATPSSLVERRRQTAAKRRKNSAEGKAGDLQTCTTDVKRKRIRGSSGAQGGGEISGAHSSLSIGHSLGIREEEEREKGKRFLYLRCHPLSPLSSPSPETPNIQAREHLNELLCLILVLLGTPYLFSLLSLPISLSSLSAACFPVICFTIKPYHFRPEATVYHGKPLIYQNGRMFLLDTMVLFVKLFLFNRIT